MGLAGCDFSGSGFAGSAFAVSSFNGDSGVFGVDGMGFSSGLAVLDTAAGNPSILFPTRLDFTGSILPPLAAAALPSPGSTACDLIVPLWAACFLAVRPVSVELVDVFFGFGVPEVLDSSGFFTAVLVIARHSGPVAAFRVAALILMTA
ncbi:hypothetical protein H4P12_11490 [Paracoccus sp. 11-3]|uniref:Uncharacterized protein n=1 Tax=Paracoccus amoyensis TaxID=2760093 RepID=A0A926GHZ0_9RHOB|nr:hypothetical protein [Paracoccus amoyensis]MBC9247317.1 hypothetical protein [Paracoccus amoyensis]